MGYEDSIIPDNFNELPFEEQLSIYNLVKEQGAYSCYGYTKLIETEEYFLLVGNIDIGVINSC